VCPEGRGKHRSGEQLAYLPQVLCNGVLLVRVVRSAQIMFMFMLKMETAEFVEFEVFDLSNWEEWSCHIPRG
jgi:hypothetical protein